VAVFAVSGKIRVGSLPYLTVGGGGGGGFNIRNIFCSSVAVPGINAITTSPIAPHLMLFRAIALTSVNVAILPSFYIILPLSWNKERGWGEV
jgi:hypothetical protein